MGREIVPRAPRRPRARGIGLESGLNSPWAQVRIWLEKTGHSGQGDGRFGATLTRGADTCPTCQWNADDRTSEENQRRSLRRRDSDSPPDHGTGRRLLAALSDGVRAD